MDEKHIRSGYTDVALLQVETVSAYDLISERLGKSKTISRLAAFAQEVLESQIGFSVTAYCWLT